MKIKVGDMFFFDSASQTIWDVWGRPIMISGKHIFVKQKDTLMDKLYRRSWYVIDNALLVDIGRGSYVETRCLEKMEVS